MKTDFIYQGDALEVLRTLPDESINCCVTSPPYWKIRDYGVAGQLGLERTVEEYVAKMVEIFREVRRVLKKSGVLFLNLGDSYFGGGRGGGGSFGPERPGWRELPYGISGKVPEDCPLHDSIWNHPCDACQAVSVLRTFHSSRQSKGGLSRGSSVPNQAHKEAVHGRPGIGDSLGQKRTRRFSDAKPDRTQKQGHVGGPPLSSRGSISLASSSGFLRDDSSLSRGAGCLDGADSEGHGVLGFVDKKVCTCGKTQHPSASASGTSGMVHNVCPYLHYTTPFHDVKIKPKDLVGIPWSVAFALRADGWYLRSDIIWSKPNPMPESVRDRPTRSHEYVFLLSKSKKYYYDYKAILECGTSGPSDIKKMIESLPRIGGKHKDLKDPLSKANAATNIGKKRAVGGFYKKPSGWNSGEGNHRSHRELIGRYPDKQRGHSRRHAGFNDRWDAMKKIEQCSGLRNKRSVWTIATAPFAGAHFATFPSALIEPMILAGCPKDGIVLDPFIGSGTTGKVALQHGRHFVGIELNPKYVEMANERIWGRLFNKKSLYFPGESE